MTPPLHRGLVSVVVPAYGHRDFVRATLESVFAQTYPDVEVIVVDDGSPDDTADLVRPLVAAGRVRLVSQANQGQGAARNRGLAEARGELVAFLDDDDLWPPEVVERHVAALRAEPEAVLVYGDYVRLRPDGTLTERWEEPRPSGDAYDGFRLRNHMISPGQALMRTEAVRAVGGFDASIRGSDDWDLWLRLARRGPFVHERRVALHYRDHATNASRRALGHALAHLTVVRRHIGWDLPLLVRHQRAASSYFVPNLLRFAEGAPSRREAVAAHLVALLFRPTLAARPAFARSLLGAALTRSRSRAPSTPPDARARSRGA